MRLAAINKVNASFGAAAALFLYFLAIDAMGFFIHRSPDKNAETGVLDAHERIGPIEHFASVSARPLFLPSRRVAVIGQTQAPEAAPRLVGVISIGGKQYALLRLPGAPTVLVAVGQRIQGWRVDGMDGTKVRLIGPDGTTTTSEAQHDAAIPASGDR